MEPCRLEEKDAAMLLRKKKKGNNVNGSSWTELPDELLEMIAERVAVRDYVSFSRVCRVWRNIVAATPYKQSYGFPCLVLSGETETKTRTFFSILERKVIQIEFPKAYGRYFWGSFKEWLITVKLGKTYRSKLSLLNPFSGAEVLLPWILEYYHKLVLSRSPSEQSCNYMLLYFLGRGVELWIPGCEGWLTCHLVDRPERFVDAIFFNGYFHLLSKDSTVRTINASSAYDTIKREGSAAGIKSILYKVEMPVDDELNFYRVGKHLVESRGEILLVCRGFRGDDSIETYAFNVYRLDFSRMMHLNDLGDRILFIRTDCSFSSSAKELGVASGNSIVFTNEGPNQGENEFDDVRAYGGSQIHDWGAYSINNSRGGGGQFSFILNEKRWQPIWISAPVRWYCRRNDRLP